MRRRDTAIIAVLRATGIRLAELAGLLYDPGDPQRGDIDLWQREITVRGKGGKDRIVRIGHHAARSLDRYSWVHVMLYGRARIRPEIIILVILSALLILVLTGHGLWLAREAAAWGLAAGAAGVAALAAWVLTCQGSRWYRLGGAAIMVGLSIAIGYAIRLLRRRKS